MTTPQYRYHTDKGEALAELKTLPIGTLGDSTIVPAPATGKQNAVVAVMYAGNGSAQTGEFKTATKGWIGNATAKMQISKTTPTILRAAPGSFLFVGDVDELITFDEATGSPAGIVGSIEYCEIPA